MPLAAEVVALGALVGDDLVRVWTTRLGMRNAARTGPTLYRKGITLTSTIFIGS
jgi:hypothetical protein